MFLKGKGRIKISHAYQGTEGLPHKTQTENILRESTQKKKKNQEDNANTQDTKVIKYLLCYSYKLSYNKTN